MKKSITPRGATIAMMVAALLTAAPASAALSESAVDCRSSISKNYGKLLKTTAKTIAKCHKSRNKNKDAALLSVDCNDVDQADLKDKLPKAYGKFTDKVTGDCPAGLATTLTTLSEFKQYYVSCPVTPCAGVTDNIDSIAELTACLVCTAGKVPGDAATATLGLPDPAELDKDEAKCHAAVAKGYMKYLSAAHKVETKCQSGQDDLGNNELDDCIDDDPKGKVAKALTKAAEGLDKKCPGTVNLTDLNGCSDVSLGDLKTCTAAAWQDAEDEAFTSTYELPGLQCPSTVRTTIRSRCSVIGDSTVDCTSGFDSGTVLNVGWTGLGHNLGIADAYTIAVDVTCPGSEKGSCGTCTSDGISYDNPQYDYFARCIDDPWTECTNPFGFDAACNNGGGGDCKYYLGPPLNVSAGGTPTCTMNYLATDITGTGDPDAGSADFALDLRALVHLGLSQTRPCPYCRNDATPQDGSKDGTCFDGPRDGQPCDVQAWDLNFANPNAPDDLPNAGVSLDCPPFAAANISGAGLVVQLPLTTGTTTKDAEDPCESPNGGLDCFCGVCSLGGGTTPCNNDLECSNMGLGTCGQGGGIARKPNNCTGLSCTVDSLTDRGICAADIDTYCSGAVFAHGKGIIACGDNADCDTYVSGSANPDNWVCPGNDCGTCDVLEFRSCFLDPMSLTGTPDPENPIMVGTFCLPPSSNGSVNSATGSPGPGSVQTDALVELRYVP